MNSIEGRAALVTGSATGVGRATALALAKRGCHVLINYSRSREDAEATLAEVEAHGVRAVLARGDVSSDADCRGLVAAATEAFGRLDILVNNAGTTSFIKHDDLEAVGDEDWARIMAVNVQGPFQCARAARSALEASGDGSIVNVSSVAGIRAIGSSIPYCASKAALNNLTISLARALAPKIRVNAVAPGFITGRWLTEGLGERYEVTKAQLEQRVPLRRVSEPSDVADAILSIVTGSKLVTGQLVAVEGGMLLS